jgi:hypothetical protein
MNKHLQYIICEYLFTTLPFKKELVKNTQAIFRIVNNWHFYSNKSIKHSNDEKYPFGIYPIGSITTYNEKYHRYLHNYWSIRSIDR